MEDVRGKREEGRGKKEEGRRKREEGRGKREEGRSSNAHYNPYSSTPFQLLYLMFLDLSSCICAPTLLQALRNRYGLRYIAFRPNSYYGIVNLSNTRTPMLLLALVKLLDLKSALLIALHASALTSLTSVTTRQSRSELEFLELRRDSAVFKRA